MAELMIGAELRQIEHGEGPHGEGAVRLKRRPVFTLAGEPPFGTDLEAGIGFEARAGEILGIAGVAGNGQAELLTALSGERPAGRARTGDPARRQADRQAGCGSHAGRSGPRLRARGAQRPCRRAGFLAGGERHPHRAPSPAADAARASSAASDVTRFARIRDQALRRPHHGAKRRWRVRCRAAICKNSSWGARSASSAVRAGGLSADLGRRCRCGRRDPPGTGRSRRKRARRSW